MATPQDTVQQKSEQSGQKPDVSPQMIVIGTGDHGDFRFERQHTPEEKPLDDFEKENGVYVNVDHGQYLYYLPGKGSWELLHATDATPEGLAEAKRYIGDETRALQHDIEKAYGVTFSGKESVGRQWVTDAKGNVSRGEEITSRPPHLGELRGISEALAHSAPSQYTKEGGAVKFYFLQKEYRTDGSGTAEFIAQDPHGHPAIYFGPDSVKIPILAKDATELNKDGRAESMESLTEHELVHNSQRNTGWDNLATEEKYARAMGWVPITNPRTREREWLLKGKDGQYYNPGVSDATQAPKWFRCDAAGHPVNEHGVAVPRIQEAPHYTPEQMRKLALIEPTTSYFTNPEEMFAEGLMTFRLSEADRQSIQPASPGFYKLLKDYDQQEINNAYGVSKTGKPLYIRRLDGLIDKASGS